MATLIKPKQLSSVTRRNAIINGNFDIWQRSNGFTSISSGTYTADRWVKNHDGGGTHQVSKQSFTLGQTDVPNEPSFYLRYDQLLGGGGGTLNFLAQPIEGVRTFAGQDVTVSFYAKADTNRIITSALNQDQNSTDSIVEAVHSSGNLNLTTSWQKFTYTVTLGSISSFTVNEAANSLNLVINFPLNATLTIDIAQVQVEQGNTASDFERRTLGEELTLCQRYYEQSFVLGKFPGDIDTQGRRVHTASTGSTGTLIHTTVFVVPKRVIPTVVVYNPHTGTAGAVAYDGTADETGAPTNISQADFNVITDNTTIKRELEYNFTAVAEL